MVVNKMAIDIDLTGSLLSFISAFLSFITGVNDDSSHHVTSTLLGVFNASGWSHTSNSIQSVSSSVILNYMLDRPMMAIVWSINNIPHVSAIGLTVLAVKMSYTWRSSLPQFTSALQAPLPTLPYPRLIL